MSKRRRLTMLAAMCAAALMAAPATASADQASKQKDQVQKKDGATAPGVLPADTITKTDQEMSGPTMGTCVEWCEKDGRTQCCNWEHGLPNVNPTAKSDYWWSVPNAGTLHMKAPAKAVEWSAVPEQGPADEDAKEQGPADDTEEGNPDAAPAEDEVPGCEDTEPKILMQAPQTYNDYRVDAARQKQHDRQLASVPMAPSSFIMGPHTDPAVAQGQMCVQEDDGQLAEMTGFTDDAYGDVPNTIGPLATLEPQDKLTDDQPSVVVTYRAVAAAEVGNEMSDEVAALKPAGVTNESDTEPMAPPAVAEIPVYAPAGNVAIPDGGSHDNAQEQQDGFPTGVSPIAFG